MCFLNKRKILTSNTIDVLPSISTPNIKSIDPIKQIEELEIVMNEIVSQLNNYYIHKIKTSEECIEYIYSLVLFTCKKYNISK